jgi:hypothetical protein
MSTFKPLFIIAFCMFVFVAGLWLAEWKYKKLKDLSVSASISLIIVFLPIAIIYLVRPDHYGLLNKLIQQVFIIVMFVPELIAFAIFLPFGLINRGNMAGPLEGNILFIIGFIFYTLVIFAIIRKRKKLRSKQLQENPSVCDF